MSGKDMLSQEEIDALLRQNNDHSDSLQDEHSGETDLESLLSPFEQDTLGEIGNISFGSAATALSMLLGQKVDITTPTVSVITRDELEKEFPQPHVAVHVRYTDGFEGINLLVIKTEDAKIIADLMLGGDGTNLQMELSDMHVSAVQEAMNQMMGSSATSMSTIFNKMVNITPPGIDIIDFSTNQGTEQLPQDDFIIKVSFQLKVGNLIDSSLMQLLPVSFARHMVDLLTGTMTEEEAATTYAPPPSQSSTKSSNESGNSNHYQESSRSNNSSNETKKPNREVNVQPVQFASFEPVKPGKEELANLGLLLDISLQVTVELGRTKKSIKEIL
ncbi:MAG: flagellar motor switch phosphatase FliY, partial [Bacilli bacterium]